MPLQLFDLLFILLQKLQSFAHYHVIAVDQFVVVEAHVVIWQQLHLGFLLLVTFLFIFYLFQNLLTKLLL